MTVCTIHTTRTPCKVLSEPPETVLHPCKVLSEHPETVPHPSDVLSEHSETVPHPCEVLSEYSDGNFFSFKTFKQNNFQFINLLKI
jgi:hypothetical protein